MRLLRRHILCELSSNVLAGIDVIENDSFFVQFGYSLTGVIRAGRSLQPRPERFDAAAIFEP
jgi:hypothetical protein